ncbi:MAG TPA: adenylyltransferase/cytidyltransferase family protein [Candidatus Nanoarchaeia archaeon]|nr:adenylyltransferase/cytidyltransferase family protein [Candidatus Nanoarchaeia archaeon]
MELDFKELKELKELAEIIKEEKKKGKKIIFTNGCFDILHKGHRYILTEAAKYGDIFIVALNSDKSVKKFKGDDRPKNKELDRAYVVSGFKGVDYVIIFNEDKPLELLRRLKPDINVKGGAAIPERVEEEKQIMGSYGGKIINLPLVEGYSTTKMIDEIRENK